MKNCDDGTSFDSDKSHVLLYFTATWCGPCKTISPIVESYSNNTFYKHVEFYKIDIDECPSIVDYYNITSVPTFILKKTTEKDLVIQTFQGADNNKLEQMLLLSCSLGSFN